MTPQYGPPNPHFTELNHRRGTHHGGVPTTENSASSSWVGGWRTAEQRLGEGVWEARARPGEGGERAEQGLG